MLNSLRFGVFIYLILISTFSWEALAAEPTAIPDDPSTKVYRLKDGNIWDINKNDIFVLISNKKMYKISCHNHEQWLLKIAKELGFITDKKKERIWFFAQFIFRNTKKPDDPEITEAAPYEEQPNLACDDQNIILFTEGEDYNKRYLIFWGDDLNRRVLYEVGCQGLVDALGLTWQKSYPRNKYPFNILLKDVSKEYINCKTGVPVGLFRDSYKDGNGKGPKMVAVPSGSFRMGDINGKGYKNEQPVHEVELNSFAISQYEITVEEYQRFVKATDNNQDQNNYPVTNVSWKDATAYTAWLSEKTGKHYRLPTEEEWEYAARAGTETVYGWGNEINKDLANYRDKNESWDNKKLQPVGSFKPNAFGVYDMVGNVLEWTCSKYEHRYQGKEKECFKGGRSSQIVLRGSSFIQKDVRISKRYQLSSENRDVNIGFRVVRVSQ